MCAVSNTFSPPRYYDNSLFPVQSIISSTRSLPCKKFDSVLLLQPNYRSYYALFATDKYPLYNIRLFNKVIILFASH